MSHRRTSTLFLSFTAFLCLACGCASLPKPHLDWSVRGNVETKDTAWSKAIALTAAAHPDASGIKLLPYGLDAFAARLALADSAERTLDL